MGFTEGAVRPHHAVVQRLAARRGRAGLPEQQPIEPVFEAWSLTRHVYDERTRHCESYGRRCQRQLQLERHNVRWRRSRPPELDDDDELRQRARRDGQSIQQPQADADCDQLLAADNLGRAETRPTLHRLQQNARPALV